MEKQRAGRKPLGERPLTSAEKMRRQRAKRLCQVKAAEESGYAVCQVLISKAQLASLTKHSMIVNGGVNCFDEDRLNEAIFYALKGHLAALKQDHKAWPQPELLPELLNAWSYPDDYIADFNKLGEVQVRTQELFKQWELTEKDFQNAIDSNQ